MSEKRILLARKPYDVADIKKQITGKISPAEVAEIVKEKKIEEKTFKDWQYLMKANLSEQQYWRVFLEVEDELLFIDTSGYDYPRYVGLLERKSDNLFDDENISAYKEHFFVMMNDLSKDELIQQIWDSKKKEEKLSEAKEFSKTMDW